MHEKASLKSIDLHEKANLLFLKVHEKAILKVCELHEKANLRHYFGTSVKDRPGYTEYISAYLGLTFIYCYVLIGFRQLNEK